MRLFRFGLFESIRIVVVCKLRPSRAAQSPRDHFCQELQLFLVRE